MKKFLFILPLILSTSCQDYFIEKRVCTVKSVEKRPPAHSLTPEYTYYAVTDCNINLSFKREVQVGDTFTLHFYKPSKKN